MDNELRNRIISLIDRTDRLSKKKDVLINSKNNAISQLESIEKEQVLIKKSLLAINQVRPLLAISSIKQCEELANTAMASIFQLPYTVEFDVESSRFILNKGDYSTDLAESEGGGVNAVISFIFSVYLLVKMGSRKFITFDEAFTQISTKYFDNFIQFVRQLCKDLNIDILLITHDQRITINDVDHAYLIEDGEAKKLK